MAINESWNNLKQDMSCLRTVMRDKSIEPLKKQDIYEIIEKIDELRTIIAEKRFGKRKNADLKLANTVYNAVMPLATLMIIANQTNDKE